MLKRLAVLSKKVQAKVGACAVSQVRRGTQQHIITRQLEQERDWAFITAIEGGQNYFSRFLDDTFTTLVADADVFL